MVGNFYFRFYLSELGLTLSDLDNLTVQKYDELYREATE